MAVAGFKPVLGALTLGAAGFAPVGDSEGFCSAILNRRLGGQPARLEPLTYLAPVQGQEAGGRGDKSPVVVNLLMQLRASCDQNNIFLRTGRASQAQILAQLRQALAQSGQTVRTQAKEIERAVRASLFQEDQFRKALVKLEFEVKKKRRQAGAAGPCDPQRRDGRRCSAQTIKETHKWAHVTIGSNRAGWTGRACGTIFNRSRRRRKEQGRLPPPRAQDSGPNQDRRECAGRLGGGIAGCHADMGNGVPGSPASAGNACPGDSTASAKSAWPGDGYASAGNVFTGNKFAENASPGVGTA